MTTTDAPHEVTAEWDADAGKWVHSCTVCRQTTWGAALLLPCPGPPDDDAPQEPLC